MNRSIKEAGDFRLTMYKIIPSCSCDIISFQNKLLPNKEGRKNMCVQ